METKPEQAPVSPPGTDRENIPFGRREGAFLLFALPAAVCYAFLHHGPLLDSPWHLPGAGLTLTQWLAAALCLLWAKREGRLRFRGRMGGAFLLALSLGLGACFFLFADDGMRLMNLPVVILATALALFSLTGVTAHDPLTGSGLREGLRRFLPACFRSAPLPFRAVQSAWRGKGGLPSGLGLGLLIALPAALIALVLLSSADNVFADLISGAAQSVAQLPVATLARLLIAAGGALVLFSFLCETGRGKTPLPERARPRLGSVTCASVLALLSLVYGLFVYVQIKYLFGGVETVAMAGGYAAYARSGFFQLVALSALTLLFILPILTLGDPTGPVRALCAVTALLTGVIVFSAFFRMRLYIQAYGMTVLRAVTLWGIGMILLALLGCLVKCVRPRVPICPALTALALVTWLALNLANVDALVARYQVRRCNEGTLARLDLGYLTSLSPDALPALKELRDAGTRNAALNAFYAYQQRRWPAPYDWSLGWLSIPRPETPEPAQDVPEPPTQPDRFTRDSALSYDGRFQAYPLIRPDEAQPVTIFIRDARMNEPLCKIQLESSGAFDGFCWESFSYRLWVRGTDGSLTCCAPQWTLAPEAETPRELLPTADGAGD